MRDAIKFLSPVLYEDFAVHSQGKDCTNLLPENLGGVTVSTDDA